MVSKRIHLQPYFYKPIKIKNNDNKNMIEGGSCNKSLTVNVVMVEWHVC